MDFFLFFFFVLFSFYGNELCLLCRILAGFLSFCLDGFILSEGSMQGNPFSEVFWMGLLTHKLGVFRRFWKRFRGIFICAFGKQECGEVTGGETSLRLEGNSLTFCLKRFGVWR